jgi:phosphoenolpyruvate carboxykinase (diphosphate)
MLRPELQDMDVFVDGMDNIVATQKRVAQMYFDDGSLKQACPPLNALLHIMLNDDWEGRGLDHPEVRKLFTREYLLASDWYAARLKAKQAIDQKLWRRNVEYLDKFLKRASHAGEAQRLGIANKLTRARKNLEQVESPAYLETLRGTLGAEPIEAYL